jgi:hypothetical protein
LRRVGGRFKQVGDTDHADDFMMHLPVHDVETWCDNRPDWWTIARPKRAAQAVGGDGFSRHIGVNAR